MTTIFEAGCHRVPLDWIICDMTLINGDGERVFTCDDGGQLRYSIGGKGDSLVLLHGFGLDSSMWDPQWPTFAKHYRSIRYDLRGYGASSVPTGAYSHVDDFIALTDFLKAQPAHLVGLSLGGRLALRIAAQAPETVRSLTLVDTALDGHLWSEDWSERWQAMLAAGNTDVKQAKSLWLQHALFKPARTKPEVAVALDAMVQRYSGWHFHSDDPGVGPATPVAEVLSTIRVPTLVIVGALDLPDFQVIARRLADELPRASLRIIPNVGHMPNLEDSHQFNQLVLAHLASCAA
jgi:3-oxoadipate enol-lactonase